ncbi:MAG: DUF721 domain-containing protein [Candidatus Buchananbacteria bacterium]
MSMHQLKDLLQRSVNRAGISKEVEASLICEKFLEVVKETFGAAWQKNCKPLYVKNNTITVACLNNVVAQEIKLREKVLLASLEKILKKKSVERIRFVI